MTIAPATLTNEASGAVLTVQFNPATLKVSIQNKLQDEESGAGGARGGGGGPARQSTRASTAKMDIELVFDTTETGADVRGGAAGTEVLRAFGTAAEGDHPTPPVVEFRWGGFSFVGLIESLSETFDFWSAEGVPLRATVQISMQRTRVDPVKTDLSAALTQPRAATIATAVPYSSGATAIASLLGNAGAGRAIAAINGLADMRMTAGGSVAVSAGIELKAAARFELAAGVSAGASLGFGIGATASAGASAGIGASASAGFGASASAGVRASAGAFAGLGASKTASIGGLNAGVLLPPPPPVGASASFDITGKAVARSSGLDAQLSAGGL